MDTTAALFLADLVGVAVFAASGASAAVAKRLDLFDVVFVGFVAALGGGVLRDIVIDEFPPLAFADWRYATTAAVASLVVFWFIRSSPGCAVPSCSSMPPDSASSRRSARSRRSTSVCRWWDRSSSA